ncbi:hypothetical protein J2W59_001533 [Pseudomonas fluorescens]|nr:hypothetical protein [Pseudomonas fluorescens]
MHGTPRKRLREMNYGKASWICQRYGCIRNAEESGRRIDHYL